MTSGEKELPLAHYQSRVGKIHGGGRTVPGNLQHIPAIKDVHSRAEGFAEMA